MFVYEVEVSMGVLDLPRSAGLFRTIGLAEQFVKDNTFYSYNIKARLVKENIGVLELQDCEGGEREP